jgi:hypothetical protein
MSELNDATQGKPSEIQEPKKGVAPNQSDRLKQEALELRNRAEPFTTATQRALSANFNYEAFEKAEARRKTAFTSSLLARIPEPKSNDSFLDSDEIKVALAKAKSDNARNQPANAEYIRSLERLDSLTPDGLKAVAALTYEGYSTDSKGISLADARHLDNLEHTKKALAELMKKGTPPTDKDFETYLLDPETSPALKLGMMEVKELLAQRRQRDADRVSGRYTEKELSDLKVALDAIKFGETK